MWQTPYPTFCKWQKGVSNRRGSTVSRLVIMQQVEYRNFSIIPHQIGRQQISNFKSHSSYTWFVQAESFHATHQIDQLITIFAVLWVTNHRENILALMTSYLLLSSLYEYRPTCFTLITSIIVVSQLIILVCIFFHKFIWMYLGYSGIWGFGVFIWK